MFNRKTWKTFLSMALVLGMIFAVGGASAFADNYIVQNEDKTEDALTLEGENWEDALVVQANAGENSCLTVNGDVTVTGEGYLYPANVYANDGGVASLSIDGDLKVKGTEGCDGLYVYAYGEGSEATASVVGNVEPKGGNTNGVYVTAEDGGTASVVVDGDVSAFGIGVGIGTLGDNSSAELVVNGTVSSAYAPVALFFTDEDVGQNSLTVWKIEPNEDGKLVVANYIDDGELVYDWDPALTDEENEAAAEEYFAATRKAKSEAAAAAFEATINYIIRVDNDNATLAGTTSIQGFDTAKEGETVTVKVAGGYRVVSATNNGEALLQDADGNYFLVVPKGGGVSISLLTELAAVAKATTGKATVTTADGVEIEATFYDDGAFKLVINGSEVVRGHAKVVDGKLVLVNSHGVECPVADDGTVRFQIGRNADSVIEFKLDLKLVAELIEQLG